MTFMQVVLQAARFLVGRGNHSPGSVADSIDKFRKGRKGGNNIDFTHWGAFCSAGISLGYLSQGPTIQSSRVRGLDPARTTIASDCQS